MSVPLSTATIFYFYRSIFERVNASNDLLVLLWLISIVLFIKRMIKWYTI